MRFRRRYSALLCVVAISAVLGVSCKKDDESSTSKTLTGYPSFSLEGRTYIRQGDVISVSAATVSRDEGDEGTVGYYIISPLADCELSYNGGEVVREISVSGKNDTLKNIILDNGRVKFDYKVSKDTIGTFTLTVSAYSKGYYNRSSAGAFTIVDAETSLEGIEAREGETSFTDPRDGKAYRVNTAGGLQWFSQNLDWYGPVAGNAVGRGYEGCDAAGDVFGRLYTWEEAKTACPDGWHLPSDAEWEALAHACGLSSDIHSPDDFPGVAGSLMVNAVFNKEKMWEYYKGVDITSESGIDAIPTGYAFLSGSSYKYTGIGSYAFFWTSDQILGKAIARYINERQNILFAGRQSMTDFAASVRCVK